MSKKINMYKHVLSTIAAVLLFCGVSNAQIVERSVEATEYLQTGVSFIYRGVDIPVLDISYHEWSSDSITWSKTYTEGDCYLRISNDVKDTWVGINVCGGSGTGTSQIDTIIICSEGVCDTITTGTVTVNIPAPITITGTTANTSTDTTHTHEIVFYMGDVENVDTTAVVDGYVLKWNATLQKWVGAQDLIGGGSAGYLRVKEQDGTPDVSNVVEIRVENAHLTNEGAGAVSIDFFMEVTDGKQDFFRTDTATVSAGDTFLTFSTPFPDADYIVDNVYALYSNGERQNLSYDSLAADGFRVLSVLDESIVHYLVMRNLDSLGLAANNQGRVLGSATDGTMSYLNGAVDDSTITVINNELTVINSPHADSVFEGEVYIDSNAGLEETLTDLIAHTSTPHISSGADITDLGNDSIAISGCYSMLKTANSDAAPLMAVYVEADTFGVSQDTNWTISIDYNGGSPMYGITQAQAGSFYQNWDKLLFATTVNIEDRIIVRNFKNESINSIAKVLLGQANTEPVRVLGDGIDVTDEGSRQFSTDIGAALFLNEFQYIMPINTSTVDTFTRVYYDGATWVRTTGETAVNNTQYNNVLTGLVSLSSGYYTNKWLYYVNDAPSYWMVLDGQSQHGYYAEAYSITEPPILPPELSAFYAGAVLVGKIMVQEGNAEIVVVQNPFDINYGVSFPVITKSYAFTSQGVGAGTYYVGGFYDYPATDANLTQASTTQAYGAANTSYAAHAFVVAGGAGTVDAGVVGLRVTGTKIDDLGNRTAGYADTIITDITSQSLNEYTEAVKFIGTFTYELIVISGTPTTYSFDFNYGITKYDDFGNVPFDINALEVVGVAGATDPSFNITLIHHNDKDWTYSAAAFTITPTIITDLQTVHNTEYQLTNGDPFAFKRVPMNYGTIIHGELGEGTIVRIVTTANNSVQNMNVHTAVNVIR